MQAILKKLVEGSSLTRSEATLLMRDLMDGSATPAQIGALLIALRIKGETIEEVTGFVQEMRARLVPVPAHRKPLLDTCGAGGAACKVFNVSTAAALVAAAAGVAVAKHGNRAISGVCGSADVLEALGVRIDLTPQQCAACIDTLGIGFIFAPAHHPALKHVGGPRRELGVRTIFNLLGPLGNPAGAEYQVMGVYDAALCPLAAGALGELGSRRALVVHGEVGIGEISTVGLTSVAELRDGEVSCYTLTPHDLGLDGSEPSLEDLAPAPTAIANADLLRTALAAPSKDRAVRSRQDLIAVNAGAALRVAGVSESWHEAVRMARDVISSGEPLRLLDRLAAFTIECSG